MLIFLRHLARAGVSRASIPYASADVHAPAAVADTRPQSFFSCQSRHTWYNSAVVLVAAIDSGKTCMSKKLQSTIMLFLIGIGFGIFSVWSLANVHTQPPAEQRDDVIQALLYMIPAIAAFVALFLLPFRQTD
jgi:hypothetical protein